MPAGADTNFRQSIAIDPEMSVWVDLACEYLALEKKPQRKNLLFGALRGFLLNFIIGKEQPRAPGEFLQFGHNGPPIDYALGDGNFEFRRQKRNKLYDFLLWILETRFSHQLGNKNSVVLEGYRIPFSRSNKSRDYGFLWLTAAEPSLETWRRYAANYLGLHVRARGHIKGVIDKFLGACIVHHVEHFDPQAIFRAADNLPSREEVVSVSCEGTRNRYDFTLGDFLEWVLNQEIAKIGEREICDLRNPYPQPRKRRKLRQDGRTTDREFNWILELDPEMETWRLLAAEYTSQVLPKNPRRWWSYREYLGGFLERYILELNQPRDPRSFLHVDYSPPPIANIFASDESPLPLLYDFVKWILRDGRKTLGVIEREVDRSELRNPFVDGIRVGNKSTDISLSWLSEIHPDLEEWREVSADYIRTTKRGIQHAMCSLRALFSRVILPNRSWWRPSVFLKRGNAWPAPNEWLKGSEDYRGTVLRSARDFIEWVLVNHLSVEDDNGRRVVPYELTNPFAAEIIPPSSQTYTESNKTPLPYRYIDECRRILKQGSSFKEWTFAQRHLFGPIGGDWFEVPFVSIDETDPNCVWEKREVNVYQDRTAGGVRKKRTAYFLWCPARAVALYIKLLLPLRTHQVRVLDSGEADTFRFSPEMEKPWSLNDSPLARGSEKKPHQRGVFRRFGTLDGQEMTGFYINTNKTADVGKDGASRGYFIPWQYDEALEWLVKLRNWQEKYNPIDAPTSWKSLDNRHVPLKSEPELLALGDTCFLFRDAAAKRADKQKPIPRGHVEPLWNRVCAELEERIYSQRTLLDGERIRFVRVVERRNRKFPLSLFPLHSLRVSLLTLFALEGGVPLVYLSKLLAGHARLLMTIYYIKPGILEMTETMAEAITRLGDGQMDGEFRWLAEAAERGLDSTSAYNDRAAIDAVLNGKSGAGWIWDAKGVCPVGRARCDDGGPVVSGKDTKDRRGYAPVPGGPGNCVRCRFFITGPAFLPGLVAHQNLLSYRFGELGRRYQEMDERISNLKDRRDSALAVNSAFRDEDQRELRRVEVEFERIQGEIDHVGRDVVATHRLIQRSLAILNHSTDGNDELDDDPTIALVASGVTEDVRVSLEEVTELHQLSVLCENAVLYPESEAHSAIYRRSQLIDAALETRRLEPLLCRLSKEEQLRVGNHIMRFLSAHAGSMRNAVGILESTDRLINIGLITDAIQSVADQSIIANSVSLATLATPRSLSDHPFPQELSASMNRDGGN